MRAQAWNASEKIALMRDASYLGPGFQPHPVRWIAVTLFLAMCHACHHPAPLLVSSMELDLAASSLQL